MAKIIPDLTIKHVREVLASVDSWLCPVQNGRCHYEPLSAAAQRNALPKNIGSIKFRVGNAA